MIKPDYKEGSIVNLMSSIGSAMGDNPLYKPLKKLPPRGLNTKNIVMLLIDGLGFDYIMKQKKAGVFKEYLKGEMTAVFPPTTASSITSYMTGLAPQQHAITGFHMLAKEIGTIITPLRMTAKGSTEPLKERGIEAKQLLDQVPFTNNIIAESYLVIPKIIYNSDYNNATAGSAKQCAYRTMGGYFRQIRKALKANRKSGARKFIYAYWGQFDKLSHDYGNGSRKVKKHFKDLEKKTAKFLKKIKGTDTTVIITADHGFIDTPREKVIIANEHPKLMNTLTLPLCGEPRAVYCYVHPSKAREFEHYVKTELSHCCDLHKSQNLIDNNWFGLYAPNPKLEQRVGDYILVMKENYIMKDKLMGDELKIHIGNHGGVSREEMLVPLIVIKD